MRSLISVLVAVLLTASLATVACGDTMYVDFRNNSVGSLEAYDLDTAVLSQSIASFAATIQGGGLALSPDGSTLYMGHNPIDSDSEIRRYNADTGAELTTWAHAAGSVLGVATDSSGNVYVARYTANSSADNNISMYTSAGVLTAGWGDAVTSLRAIVDLEVRGTKLYGAVSYSAGSGQGGVWTWDLNGGGAPTQITGSSGIHEVKGLAFDSAGTMYTLQNAKDNGVTAYKVLKWSSDLSTYTELVDLGSTGCIDLDYFGGSLYATQRETAADGTGWIYEINPSTGVKTTWKSFTNPSKLGYGPQFMVQKIPEPGTLALAVMGLLGLLAYAWRKQK